MSEGGGGPKKGPQVIQSKGPPPAPAGGDHTGATSSIPEIAKPEPTSAMADNGDNGPGADGGADKRTDIRYLVRAMIKYNASDLSS